MKPFAHEVLVAASTTEAVDAFLCDCEDWLLRGQSVPFDRLHGPLYSAMIHAHSQRAHRAMLSAALCALVAMASDDNRAEVTRHLAVFQRLAWPSATLDRREEALACADRRLGELSASCGSAIDILHALLSARDECTRWVLVDALGRRMLHFKHRRAWERAIDFLEK